MRHIILILMIALLPARGWTSDAMTVSMALQQLAAIQNVVTRGLDMGAGALQYFAVKTVMSAECPMQMQQAQAPGDDSLQVKVSYGCTTCQLCMALVTGYPTMPLRAVPLPQAAQVITSISFTNAERATGFKPPIS